MADPFLAIHQKSPCEFDLSGRFDPASIRDQMLRGYLLIERLFDENRLRSTSRVLVIGAGASGVTAGIRAADKGASVRIVEKQPRPFLTQRDVSTRWVCPTQYDWPLAHWKEARLPWDSSALPLKWDAGAASRVAAGWAGQLARAQREKGSQLSVEFRTECTNTRACDGFITAGFSGSGREWEESFDIVIDSHGFPDETTTIAGYAGPKFWHRGPAEWTPGGATLVVGGGDGALQDFLLLTTGLDSARNIFEVLFPAGLAADIAHRIHCAEDQCHRAWICSGSSVYDHRIFEELESRHREVLTDALMSEPEVRARTIALLAAGNRLVSIAHSCSHFGRAYALNRFLALLIIQVIEEDLGGRARFDGQKVEDIAAIDDSHVCSMNKRCYAFAHEVTMQSLTCLEPGGEISQRQFDRIVIRAGRPGSPPRRQCLPFSIPN
jgi:hypothetical protein